MTKKNTELEASAGREASECSDLLYAIRDARDALFDASNEKCTCSSFVLQYEGGCQCERGKKIAACEYAMWRMIESI